ncbi:unnamed protein product [Somion occarium]|uniref:3-beta hydroxysteroid dehydrogenase/isomerase domain-containing protein n=1 Tax=Somion occarium TaxID=3059160 RepID=A0ABP1DVN4_9APHY
MSSVVRDIYLVIGGSGFLGRHIVEALLARGDVVYVFDVVQRYHDVPFFSGDVSEEDQVSDALRKVRGFLRSESSRKRLTSFSQCGATCIIHTASPPAGLPTPALYWKVNVDGTSAVIRAAQAAGVRKLVYTSSAGVVFNGEDLINVDERRPFPEKPMDAYNETKVKAETLVLQANGQNGLLTVALRPAGIFGPGDRLMIKSLRDVYDSNRTHFQVGDNTNRFDYTYVGNVAHAHLLAADKLNEEPPSEAELRRRREYVSSISLPPLPVTMINHDVLGVEQPTTDNPADNPTKRSSFDQFSEIALDRGEAPLTVAGQAFFITNGEPLCFWDLPRLVWSRLDDLTGEQRTKKRRIVLSRTVGLVLAFVAEWWCWLIGKEPTFTRFRITFSCANRWHNIDKARLLLGYEPIVGMREGLDRMWDVSV